jgi:hypothetical protein
MMQAKRMRLFRSTQGLLGSFQGETFSANLQTEQQVLIQERSAV